MCEGCENKSGWRFATRGDGLMAIERCDTCQRFASDKTAAKMVAKKGLLPDFIIIDQEYPHYCRVLVRGQTYVLSAME